jgi:hypothetical protein
VGSLDTKKVEAPPTPPATPPQETKEIVKPQAESGTVAPVPAAEEIETLDPFGDLIPFADPSWYQGVSDSSLSIAHLPARRQYPSNVLI